MYVDPVRAASSLCCPCLGSSCDDVLCIPLFPQLYKFVFSDFCEVYIEWSKRDLNGSDPQRKAVGTISSLSVSMACVGVGGSRRGA